MIIVSVKNCKNLEHALKVFKYRVIKSGLMTKLSNKQHYSKPTEIKRKKLSRAIYIQKNYK